MRVNVGNETKAEIETPQDFAGPFRGASALQYPLVGL